MENHYVGVPNEGSNHVAVSEHGKILLYASLSEVYVFSLSFELLRVISLKKHVHAVAIEPFGTHIAVSQHDSIVIFQKTREDQWIKSETLALNNGVVHSIGWIQRELFVSNDHISVFQQSHGYPLAWSQRSSRPCEYACISSDGNYISTCGKYSQLVKVWHRTFSGPLGSGADFEYIKAPSRVCDLRWRHPRHPEWEIENVLYITTADHGLMAYSVEVVQDDHRPRLVARDGHTGSKPTLIIPNHTYSNSFARMLGRAHDDSSDPECTKALSTLASQEWDVCFQLDQEDGADSAVIESFFDKRPEGCRFDHLCQKDELISTSWDRNDLTFCLISPKLRDSDLSILHVRPGAFAQAYSLSWMTSKSNKIILTHERYLSNGHSQKIRRLQRSSDGKHLLSTNADEAASWVYNGTKKKLQPCGVFKSSMLSALPVTLSPEAPGFLVISQNAIMLVRCSEAHCDVLCKLGTENISAIKTAFTHRSAHDRLLRLAVLDQDSKVSLWTVKTADKFDIIPEQAINLDAFKECLLFSSFDPMGWESSLAAGNLKVEHEDFMTVRADGLLECWSLLPDKLGADSNGKNLRLEKVSQVVTSVDNASMVSGTTSKKAAIVDASKTQLSIFDIRASTFTSNREFFEEFDSPINDLDWTCTDAAHSILAVGFRSEVLVFAQTRGSLFTEGTFWSRIRSIDLGSLTTNTIADSVWLEGGTLCVSAGHDLFLSKSTLNAKELKALDYPNTKTGIGKSVLEVVREMNEPLPLYHPNFLLQLVLTGESQEMFELVANIKSLCDSEKLFPDLGIDLTIFTQKETGLKQANGNQVNGLLKTDVFGSQTSTKSLEDVAIGLLSLCKNESLPLLSRYDQMLLVYLFECISEAEQSRRSLDMNGYRYFMSLRIASVSSVNHKQYNEPSMRTRDFLWAFHSASQELLLNAGLHCRPDVALWPRVRSIGAALWLRDRESLLRVFDTLARNHFASGEIKNPIDCSLFYLALRKKSVLAGLWRVCSTHPEKLQTEKFLSNDFDQSRWRTAALKNAFALLGRRRYGYAAAFFLLGDSPKDAISICAKNLNDLQLAIAIARVYCGDQHDITKTLLLDIVLPRALRESDRWLASWAFWFLGRRDASVKCLIAPLEHLIKTEEPMSESVLRRASAEDPSLIVLYGDIKEKSLQTIKGAEEVSPQLEFDFIVHCARLYTRLGCNVLALQLVSTWEFVQHSHDQEQYGARRPSLVRRRRRSSVVVADLPEPKSPESPMIQKPRANPAALAEFDESAFDF